MSNDLLVVSGVSLNSPQPQAGASGFVSVQAMMGVWITGSPSGAPVIPPVIPPAIIYGGDDAYDERPRKRRKFKLEERPSKRLENILNKFVSEYYAELTAKDIPQDVRKEAAVAVRPFVKAKVKQIPPIKKVDWEALEADRAAVDRITRLWTKYIESQRISDDDDDFFMLLH